MDSSKQFRALRWVIGSLTVLGLTVYVALGLNSRSMFLPVLKMARIVTVDQLASQADTGQVITFTMDHLDSNYSKAHPTSRHLFDLYSLMSPGRRATKTKFVLEPESLELTDQAGTKYFLSAATARYMDRSTIKPWSESTVEEAPQAVRNSRFSEFQIFSVDRDKPVTFVCTVSRRPNGYALLSPYPSLMDGPIVSNESFEEILKAEAR